MKGIITRALTIVLLITVFLIIMTVTSESAGMGVSISKSTAIVGDSFTVTISGIYGDVSISSSSNVTLSTSGRQFVDGSLSISGTAKSAGSGKITVIVNDAVTTGANPQEVSGSKSASIEVKEKEVSPPPVSDPNNSGTTNNTKTNTKNNSSNNKPNNTPEETPKEEEEEATPQFGISNVQIKGISDEGNTIDITLDPSFNIDIFEYTCMVGKDIKSIEVIKEAFEYNDLVEIIGLDGELEDGENIIKLSMKKDDQELVYTIKIIKEISELMEEDSKEDEENKREHILISMTLTWFVLLQIGIIALEGIIFLLLRYILKKRIKRK